MRTPKKYTDNLNKGLITRDMLVDSLFSINARVRYINGQVKDISSSIKTVPVSETVKSLRVKQGRLYRLKRDMLKVIKSSGILICADNEKVYKIYDFGVNHMFCQPVRKKILNSYKGPIKYISSFGSNKVDVSGTLSIQFINKFYDLIKSGDYIIAEDLKPFLKKDYLEKYGRE